MRVLEQCTSSTTPEIQQQIHALREAFSRDTSKPFELKLTLGMHSPVMDQHTLVNIAVSQSMQQPVATQPSSNPGWPLTNNDDPPKPVGTAAGYMQHYESQCRHFQHEQLRYSDFNSLSRAELQSRFEPGIPTTTVFPGESSQQRTTDRASLGSFRHLLTVEHGFRAPTSTHAALSASGALLATNTWSVPPAPALAPAAAC
jgi:hypothetical protein